jgi:hypothetical protein
VTTLEDMKAFWDKMNRAEWSGPSVWMVNPRVYKRHKGIFKKLMRRHRKTALRRSVHRAYRRAGLPLPKVSR